MRSLGLSSQDHTVTWRNWIEGVSADSGPKIRGYGKTYAKGVWKVASWYDPQLGPWFSPYCFWSDDGWYDLSRGNGFVEQVCWEICWVFGLMCSSCILAKLSYAPISHPGSRLHDAMYSKPMVFQVSRSRWRSAVCW